MNLLLLLALFITTTIAPAAELTFSPATPQLKVGQQLTLSVSGTTGTVTWGALTGKIEGQGMEASYVPIQLGTDLITVLDEQGHFSSLKVKILPAYSVENANFEVFTNRDYIKHLAYSVSADGTRETLWAATEGGLEERDLKTGKVNIYRKSDGLPSSDVTALVFDSQDNLWVGTGDGLAKRSADGHWESIADLPSNMIQSLQVDENDTVWIATFMGGLVSLSTTGQREVFNKTQIPDFPSNDIYRVAVGELGIYVVFLDGNIGIRVKGESSWVVSDFSGSKDEAVMKRGVSVMAEEPNGLWIGTWSTKTTGDNETKLRHFNLVRNEYDHEYDMKGAFVTSLLFDKEGGLWISTLGDGLYYRYFYSDYLEQFKADNSGLPGDAITALQLDKQGNLWVGTGDPGGFQSYGLARRNVDGSWESFERTPLPSNNVYALEDDTQGGLWVGTHKGVAKLTKKGTGELSNPNEEGTWELFNINPDYFVPIESLYQEPQGGLWVGTFGHGLYYRDVTGKVTHLSTKNSTLPSDFTDLYIDSKNNQEGLWVTTADYGFMQWLDDHSLKIFTTANSGLPSDYNTLLADDGKGGFWVGTNRWTESSRAVYPISDDAGNLIIHEGQGLTHLNAKGEWGEVWTTANSPLPSNNITALQEDGNGGVWIGTDKQGLAHYRADGQWDLFDAEPSKLPGNSISALLMDESGGLWVGTSYYYEKDTKGDLVHDEQGNPLIPSRSGLAYRDATGEWLALDNSHGLPDNDSINVLHEDSQGGLWIGMTRGGLAHLTFGQKRRACTKTNDAGCRAIMTGKRAAIVIAGGGNDKDNTLWDTTEAIASYIFSVLNLRGFDPAEIYFLSPKSWLDFNGDGFNDGVVDAPNPEGPVTVAEIRKALEWAKERESLDQPLYLFFIDHGGTNQFQLANQVYMEVSELKQLLDDYQTVTGNPVILVMDACHSGVLLNQLQAPQRAILSSTGEGLAYFDRVEKQGFSRFLAKGLLEGRSFSEAFDYAKEEQNTLLSNPLLLTAEPENKGGVITQDPQQWEDLQNNSKPILNVCVNGCFAAMDITLAVTAQTPSATLSTGQSVSLQAKATVAQGEVKRVWAVLKPPRINHLKDQNGTPLLAFPRLTLSPTDDKTVWETSWEGAVYKGNYEIVFYAEDEQRNIASSDAVTLTITDGPDSPAQPSLQWLLETDQYQAGDSLNAQLIEHLGWGYDLYVAVVFPDGHFEALENTNRRLSPNQVQNWQPGSIRPQERPLTILDEKIPDDWSAGQYCLYGILSPAGEPVLEENTKTMWVKAERCFEVK